MIQSIKNFWQGSLRVRLIGYFMLLSLLMASVGPFLSFTLSKKALQSSIVDRLDTASTLKEAELNRWVTDREVDITLISQDPRLLIQAGVLLKKDILNTFYSPSYQNLSSYFDDVLHYNTNFSEIFILTAVGGEIVLSTSPENEGQYRVTDLYFTEGRKGLYTQNIYPSPATGKPVMTVATPIFNKRGEVLGVIAAHLNMERLDNIILERAGLGVSGETYLVDQYSSFVSEAKFGRDDFPRGVHTIGIDAALSGESGTDLYLNYNNIPVVGVYRWIPERDVALISEISQEEAFAPARELSTLIFLLGVGLSLVSFFVIYFLAQQITTPILRIAETAREVAAGHLYKTAPVLTKDEIGVLATSFNSVTERTRDLIHTLEARVAERTRALELRSTYLEGAAEIGRVAASFINADELVIQVVDLIRERFDLYYVGLFLADKNGEWAVLKAGTGKAGETMLANHHRLKIGDGMIGWAVKYGEARIALDVGEDAVRFDNPAVPDTRSEGALPLRSRGRVLGALTVQSKEASAFTMEIIMTLQTMADQIALALDNAELLARSESALKAERRAYGDLSFQSWRSIQDSKAASAYRVGTDGILKPSNEKAIYKKETQAILDGQLIQENGQVALLPIKSRGHVIGGIRVKKSEQSGKWTKEQIQLMETISEQMSVALESARLFEETQQKAQREAIISDISAKVGASMRVDTILKTTVQELGKALEGTDIAFEITGPDKDKKL